MNPDEMSTAPSRTAEVDPWEFQQFQEELKDWEFTGDHHMHKSWQFPTCQQALRWHALARELSERHAGDCLFYLGNVGSGRIDTDILNPITRHLTREDLAVAVMLNKLERDLKAEAASA